MERIASHAKTSIIPPVDQRGRHGNRRQLPIEIRSQIDDHIRSFPTRKSHYQRSHHHHSRKYLSAELTIAEMHRLYFQKYEPEVYTAKQAGSNVTPQVIYQFYREYFSTHFNLGFGRPKTDTCVTCDRLEAEVSGNTANPERAQQLRTQKVDHIRSAQGFYNEIRVATDLAKQDNSVAALSFDYSQNLPLPYVPTGEAFYLKQLWLHVFGLHDCRTGFATMYCYDTEKLCCLLSNENLNSPLGKDKVALQI